MMEYLNSGIYAIVNKVNNKRYIGQAVDLKKRKRDHLLSGHRSNKYLQNSIRKYGKSKFEFIVLEYLKPIKEILDTAEQKYFDYYIKLGKWNELYNASPTAGSCLGVKHSEESHQYHRKKIYQYDLNGVLIKEYDSVTEASKHMNVNKQTISASASKVSIMFNRYIWSYDNDLEVVLQKVKSAKIQTHDKIDKQNKPILMIDYETDEVLQEFTSLSSACTYFGKKSASTISDAARGKYKKAYGYKWKYAA